MAIEFERVMMTTVLDDLITGIVEKIADERGVVRNRERGPRVDVSWREGRLSSLPVRATFQSLVGKPDWKVSRRIGSRLESLTYIQKSLERSLRRRGVGGHVGNDRQVYGQAAIQERAIQPFQAINGRQRVGIVV